jgi:hypothetical protein
LLTDGRKIEAIKRYRLLTGASLRDARDAVEARSQQLRQSGTIVPPTTYRQPFLGNGGLALLLFGGLMVALFVAFALWNVH